MKLSCLILLLPMLIVACSDDVSGPSDQKPPWTEEKLQDGMAIAFPPGYEGNGYWCMVDACYFEKSRSDGSVRFHFPIGDMTGNRPGEFDELPEQYRHLHRTLIETNDGLEGALYYTEETEHDCEWSVGTFVIEKKGRDGFREVVWVTYDFLHQTQICEVLRTIKYVQEE